MSKFNITEITPLPLDTDDRSEDERSRGSSSKEGKATMDSVYQPESVDYNKDVTFKAEFGMTCFAESKGQREAEKYDLKKLFDAAASGDVRQLDGLHEYLCQKKKLLSNIYQPNGKNALLKALLNLKKGKNDTIESLLDIAEKMEDIKDFVNGAFTDYNYKGQTALHVAIEKRSLHYVTLLVEKGADVHARACGKFFQVHEGACFYFGELPLSLAACTNQLDIVEFLMAKGKVRIEEKDSQGNTVLHALVMVADDARKNTDFVIMIYDKILTQVAELHPKFKLEDIENNQDLTPIKLAAKTGKFGLFKHMMHREFHNAKSKHLSRKFTEWVYGPVHCSLYDLASIDSYENNSVLEIIVFGSEIQNRHEMLEVEPLNQLLDEKWKSFARWIFHFNFFVYLVYLTVFTLVAYNRLEQKPPFPFERSNMGYLQLTGHIVSAMGALYFFYKGILDFKRKRPKLQTLLVDGYCEILFFLQAVLFIISAVLYFCGKEEYVRSLVLCLALSWVNLLYFSRGYRSLGIYSVMIQKMIISDILRFLIVYIVFLFGFSAAVVTLLDEPVKNNTTVQKGRLYFTVDDTEGCKKPTFNSIQLTTLELFKFTIGMGDLEFTEQYHNKVVFYLLLITYIVLTYILLLNMLIALMSKTVEKLSQESTQIWKLQRAITILEVERSLHCCLKEKLRSGVQKELGRVAGGDKRWCIRIEEVNWAKWNADLSIINEDPGRVDVNRQSQPSRGGTWHRTVRAFSRRQPRQRPDYEMNSMSTRPIHEGTNFYHQSP
ncbi:hypothetical protein AAFF_G00127440 [Aldrovandia affinis]|uniref:Ion transport domain-containing protein n=1 Tax=Aldrovandia affinis TaxID=143900 RepID=A0AAD7WXB8_9TELE|nr:hypothetical protein AAFF_G00127440 [Aldrovandia affinis]